MARSKSKARQLTPLELRIMQVLWSGGAMNVQAVQEGLKEELAYTTVQTMLNVLVRKGHLGRERVGRAFFYRPLKSRELASGGAVRDLVNRIFNGSVESLLVNLVQSRQIDRAELARLAQKVAEAEGGSDEGSR